MRFCILLLLLLTAAPILAQDKQRCAICASPEAVAGTLTHAGKTYSFCSAGCQEKFQADPDNWATRFEKNSKTEGPGRYGKLPDFEFPGLKRTDLDNRVVVIALRAPCVAESPLSELHRQNPNDLRVIGFSNAKEPTAPKVDYPSFLEDTPEVEPFLRQLLKQVGPLKSIPVTLLVDRQGEIIYRQTGEIGDDFKNALKIELSRR